MRLRARPSGRALLRCASIGLTPMLVIPPAHAASAAYDSGSNGVTATSIGDVYRIAHHGRYSEAIGDASKVISAFPDYGPAYEARAHFETDAGLYVQARADLDRVAAMHPDDIGLALFRIELDLRQGDAKSASADIVQAQNMRATSHDEPDIANIMRRLGAPTL